MYARGQSQRGPAFRLPQRRLINAHCDLLLSTAQTVKEGPQAGHVELFIPAPPGLTRAEAERSHIATRNFFAWLCRKPIVGYHLGDALADLLNRMKAWRPASVDNVEDILMYADKMGYSTVDHCPDHALAMLAFSERARISHVWIDSFAHCVGMIGEASRSPEFAPISRATKALITRAFLEMDLHLDRTSRALVSFLENELSAAYLGLSHGARLHLDNFRSFLHTYHVGKHGYWPPYSPTNYPKELYYDLYYDFSCLYHFLADKDTTSTSHHIKSANGGICVEQNIQQFNQRHKFNSLPYTLPLLPHFSAESKTKSQRSLRSLKIGVKEASMPRTARGDRLRLQLRAASNQGDESLLRSGLVQQYITWEDTYATQTNEDVAPVDARKVRWILIYGILQTLVSAIQAPPEVRDTSAPKYPLCILTTGLPPWNNDGAPEPQTVSAVAESSENKSQDGREMFKQDEITPTLSIHPDCEKEAYFDYWSNSSSSNENQNSQPMAAWRRAGTRLRKNTLKRMSLTQQTQSNTSPQPDLVSGRTLAELAYGDKNNPQAGDSNAFHEFDFGFASERSAWAPGSSMEGGETTYTSLMADSSHSTFDDFHDSLSTQARSSSLDDSLDDTSTPSLTFSHGSRETVVSFHSGHSYPISSDLSTADTSPSHISRANSSDSEEAIEAVVTRLSIAKEKNGVTHVDSEVFSPQPVTSFTDYLKKDVDSNATSPGSFIAGGVDRAAVIENDGALENPTTESYRMLTGA